MNFSLLLKYFTLLVTIASALEQLAVQIASGNSASTPALSTYLESRHGNIVVTWTPLP